MAEKTFYFRCVCAPICATQCHQYSPRCKFEHENPKQVQGYRLRLEWGDYYITPQTWSNVMNLPFVGCSSHRLHSMRKLFPWWLTVSTTPPERSCLGLNGNLPTRCVLDQKSFTEDFGSVGLLREESRHNFFLRRNTGSCNTQTDTTVKTSRLLSLF
jgi:hypothetical protein